MSAQFRNEFTVECTQEEAFDFLSDLRNELEWNPNECQSVEKVTDGPVGLGTRFRAKWKGGPVVEVEWLHFDRPRTWRAHTGGALEHNFKCTVEPHDDGAKVVSELEIIPHGWFKLIFPIVQLMFKRGQQATIDNMRSTLSERYVNAEP